MKRIVPLALLLSLIVSLLAVSTHHGQQKKDDKKDEKKDAKKDAKKDEAKEEEKNPVVVMETSMGTIKIELYEKKAPNTVKNFLKYVDDRFYDKTIFHRVIGEGFIQGGGYEPGFKEKKPRAAIKNESSNVLLNERGTIAMARIAGASKKDKSQPDSATSQFFINVKNNAYLDRGANPKDFAGHCVFGKVIDGMDVVDMIKAVKTASRDEAFPDAPVEDVVILSVRRAMDD
jgi:peptidyl-prolyl cis-trans isomerase B (cyclophilin B)